jgi:phosphoribosylformylglycinamidine cyclo-ligase
MPDMYPPGEYDLAGFTVGAVEKSQMLTGVAIVAGDVVLGVASSGPHSNGYSLVRKILERAGCTPDNGGLDLDLGGVKLADALMAPTTIYVKSMLELLRGDAARIPNPGFQRPNGRSSQIPAIHGMAHITGGGLKENIIRVVPDGLGIALDASAIVLPPVFDWLMREGNVAREEMWRTFNCGVGFTVILPRDAVAGASALLAKHGLASSVIGEIVPAQGDERVHIG